MVCLHLLLVQGFFYEHNYQNMSGLQLISRMDSLCRFVNDPTVWFSIESCVCEVVICFSYRVSTSLQTVSSPRCVPPVTPMARVSLPCVQSRESVMYGLLIENIAAHHCSFFQRDGSDEGSNQWVPQILVSYGSGYWKKSEATM